MNTYQKHQSLVNNYKERTELVKKLGIAGMLLQAGIIGFIIGWKHIPIDHYEIAAPFLFSLSLYFLIKDFLTFHKIDVNVNQIIIEGVGIEKKNTNLGSFFHEILRDFNLVRILIQRTLVNLVAFWCIGYWIYQFIIELIPNFVVGQGAFNLLIAVFSAFSCAFYYESFKSLTNIKAQVFAK